MKWIDLLPGELELGTWTLNYLPPGGGRYTGPLLVTDRRLLFKADFDTSPGGALKELVIFKDTRGVLAIPRERVLGVEKKSGFFRKRVVVTLVGGEEHTFDRGLLSVDKLAAAIAAGRE